MQRMRTRKGQNTAEYAIVFATVLGAAIAVQQFVRSNLQGAIAHHTNAYLQAATEGNGALFEPNRTVDTASSQAARLLMDSAGNGTVELNVVSNTTSVTTK